MKDKDFLFHSIKKQIFFYLGGSEWICEDRIHLKNIELRSAVLPPVDLSVYHDHTEVSKIVHNFQDHMKHTKVSGFHSFFKICFKTHLLINEDN